MKKAVNRTAGILCAAVLILAWLITSVEIVAYGIPGYYEKEYTRYRVTENVHMEMEDLLQVTEEMMAYLRGCRPDLHVMTTVNGEAREFFNQREISHMEDVRGLFLSGLALRRGALVLAVLLIGFLVLREKRNVLFVLVRSFQVVTVLITIFLLGLGMLIASDFTRYFTIFHQIFFDNDLWLLDPATDLLINIVPEPFFMDTARYIALVFLSVPVLVLVVSACYCKRLTFRR